MCKHFKDSYMLGEAFDLNGDISIIDVGSGLNDNRSGFVKLTDLVINRKVNKLVVEHKD